MNEQKNFLYKITMFSYIVGLPNVWFEKSTWPPILINIIEKMSSIISITHYILLALTGVMPLFTQKNLKEQHIMDIMIYNMTLPLFYMGAISVKYYKDDVKQFIYNVVVYSPSIYNDPQVEAELIEKSKTLVILAAASGLLGIFMVMVHCSTRSLRNGEILTIVITAWPDIEDKSDIAGAFRILFVITWIVMVMRCYGGIILMVCLMAYTNYQFKQLQSYFCSLANIFTEDLSQLEKEKKYETALKVGLKLHSDIISYTRQLVKSCNLGYGGEIIMNVIMISAVMIRLANEVNTLANILTGALVAIGVLNVTGIYMATLGDITLEADKLTTAMYMSGWENCTRGSSVRVRKLLSIGMDQTQNSLVIYALGVIAVSFSSYASIIKFSYTVFTVVVK